MYIALSVIDNEEIETCRKTAVDLYSTFLQSSHGRDVVRLCSRSSHILVDSRCRLLWTKHNIRLNS